MAATAVATGKAFDYTSRNAAGKIVKGRLEASSEGAAVEKLHAMGLSPVDITESVAGTGLQMEINIGGFGKKRVKLKDLAIMSRQAATMVSSGLSLLRTLSILSEQSENKQLKSVLDLRHEGRRDRLGAVGCDGEIPDGFPAADGQYDPSG